MSKQLRLNYKRCFQIILVGCIVIISLYTRNRVNVQYLNGIKQIENGNYQKGIDILTQLGDFKSCNEYIAYANNTILYENALDLYEEGNYEDALNMFLLLDNFKDSDHIALEIKDELERRAMYEYAIDLYESGKCEEALNIFENLDNYQSSIEFRYKCINMLRRLENSNTLVAGVKFSCGVTQAGTILFSGINSSLGEDVRLWNDIISLSLSGDTMAGLSKDGGVVTAGQALGYYLDTSTWCDIIDVAAGQSFVIGLKSDGTLVAQGHDRYGEIGISDWHDIVAIDASARHTVGIDKTGNVFVAGYGAEQQLFEISADKEKWMDIISISAGGGFRGSGHTVALKRNGTVVAVGDNSFGQCNVDEWNNIVAISAGDFHTVGLKSDGTVVSTQNSDIGDSEIAFWDDIVAVSAGYGYTLGLKSDGTVVGAGFSLDGLRETTGWSNIAIREEWGHIFNIEDWG